MSGNLQFRDFLRRAAVPPAVESVPSSVARLNALQSGVSNS
jgi:hypothetical protein